MSVKSFPIPDDLRAFLREAASLLDEPDAELDGEDALQSACAYGGREAETGSFVFVYVPPDGGPRRLLRLSEDQLAEAAAGALTEVLALSIPRRRTRRSPALGEPLLLWGPTADDALATTDTEELGRALEALWVRARAEGPTMFHLWSRHDDLAVGVVQGDEGALMVAWSNERWATTAGNPEQVETFEVAALSGRSWSVPWADCVAWRKVRAGALALAERGELPDELPVESRVRAEVLVAARGGRAQVRARLGSPAERVEMTSLNARVIAMTEKGRSRPSSWARRLGEELLRRGDLELEDGVGLDDIVPELVAVLDDYGEAALVKREACDELADALAEIDGVVDLYATEAELQELLRRTVP